MFGRFPAELGPETRSNGPSLAENPTPAATPNLKLTILDTLSQVFVFLNKDRDPGPGVTECVRGAAAPEVRPPHSGGLPPPKSSTWGAGALNLPSSRIGNKNYNFSFGVWPVSGRTWPRDPFNRVGLEKSCRTHSELAPETNSKAVS